MFQIRDNAVASFFTFASLTDRRIVRNLSKQHREKKTGVDKYALTEHLICQKAVSKRWTTCALSLLLPSSPCCHCSWHGYSKLPQNHCTLCKSAHLVGICLNFSLFGCWLSSKASTMPHADNKKGEVTKTENFSPMHGLGGYSWWFRNSANQLRYMFVFVLVVLFESYLTSSIVVLKDFRFWDDFVFLVWLQLWCPQISSICMIIVLKKYRKNHVVPHFRCPYVRGGPTFNHNE